MKLQHIDHQQLTESTGKLFITRNLECPRNTSSFLIDSQKYQNYNDFLMFVVDNLYAFLCLY